MKKYFFLSITFLLGMLTSCKYASQIADAVGSIDMDGESAYKKAA